MEPGLFPIHNVGFVMKLYECHHQQPKQKSVEHRSQSTIWPTCEMDIFRPKDHRDVDGSYSDASIHSGLRCRLSVVYETYSGYNIKDEKFYHSWWNICGGCDKVKTLIAPQEAPYVVFTTDFWWTLYPKRTSTDSSLCWLSRLRLNHTQHGTFKKYFWKSSPPVPSAQTVWFLFWGTVEQILWKAWGRLGFQTEAVVAAHTLQLIFNNGYPVRKLSWTLPPHWKSHRPLCTGQTKADSNSRGTWPPNA